MVRREAYRYLVAVNCVFARILGIVRSDRYCRNSQRSIVHNVIGADINIIVTGIVTDLDLYIDHIKIRNDIVSYGISCSPMHFVIVCAGK